MKKLLFLLSLLLCLALPALAEDVLPDFEALSRDALSTKEQLVLESCVRTEYTGQAEALAQAVDAYLVQLADFGMTQQLRLPMAQKDCTVTLYAFTKADSAIPTMTCADASLGWVISDTHLVLDLRVYPDGTATVEIIARPELLSPAAPTAETAGTAVTAAFSPCATCNGQGSYTQDCAACDGHGQTRSSCSSCGGDGKRSCSTCGGDGNHTCSSCNGSGHHGSSHHGKHHSSSKSCSTCGGDGKRSCSSCDGSGRRQCSACSGHGKTSSRCGSCNGQGHRQVRCGNCGK